MERERENGDIPDSDIVSCIKSWHIQYLFDDFSIFIQVH